MSAKVISMIYVVGFEEYSFVDPFDELSHRGVDAALDARVLSDLESCSGSPSTGLCILRGKVQADTLRPTEPGRPPALGARVSRRIPSLVPC